SEGREQAFGLAVQRRPDARGLAGAGGTGGRLLFVHVLFKSQRQVNERREQGYRKVVLRQDLTDICLCIVTLSPGRSAAV
ncbi:hypothetical protein ACFQ12_27585, partial [Methylobacterium trifolii]